MTDRREQIIRARAYAIWEQEGRPDDLAYFRTVFTDQPDAERIIWLFSMVLGHSHMMWGCFVAHQDLQTVLRCHVAAFKAFGGVPRRSSTIA